MGKILHEVGDEEGDFQTALKTIGVAQIENDERTEEDGYNEERTKKIIFSQAFQLYLAQKDTVNENQLWENVDKFATFHKFKNLPSSHATNHPSEIRRDVKGAIVQMNIAGREYAIFLNYDDENEPTIKIFRKTTPNMWRKLTKKKFR